MRIALVASLVSPIRTAEANGPHAVILDLERGLSGRGHEVTIYAARGSQVGGQAAVREIDVDPIVGDAAVRPGGQPAPPGALSALDDGFRRLFDAVERDRPDAVSQHAFDAAAIRLSEGLPVLHTLHLPPIDAEVVDAARATRRALATVSEFSRRQWVDAGVPGVGVLRNGVPVPIAVSESLHPVREIALIAGRISPEKGTDVAIRVARRAGLTPMVVGDVYDGAYFQGRVRPLLKDGKLVSAVPRAELSRLMAQSSVLLMPVAWDEAFGLVAAEAQMVGCPVVGYRRGALPEVVIDGLGGWLVDPGDEDALAAAVRNVSTLDRERIRAWARTNLGVERMIDDYENGLIEVAARGVTPVAEPELDTATAR
jgi:glycosyltransferase involved in cell wall biosynthesis